jgi:Repeat of unknown function (DUF346)
MFSRKNRIALRAVSRAAALLALRSGSHEDQRTRRGVRGRLAVLAVGIVAAFLAGAAPASAGRAFTEELSLSTIRAHFQAYGGEDNNVEIFRGPSPVFFGNDWIDFHDSWGIDPSWGWLASHGCHRRENAGLVTDALCEHWFFFSEYRLRLGDMNDRLTVHPTTPAGRTVRAFGEDGNDDIDIRDGVGGDSVDCGPGTDWAFTDLGDSRSACENSSLGPGVTWDSPAVVSRGRDRLDVFVRGGDDRLWVRSDRGQGWSGWDRDSSGLVMTSAPAAATWGTYGGTANGVDTFTGPVDVFARGPNNELLHTWWSTTWSGQQESLGHPPTGPLTSAPAVASWGMGRLDVFVRGSDNRLWQRSCDIATGVNSVCDGGDWSTWQQPPIGGGNLGSAPAAVSWGLGRIDVFTRGTDSALYHVSFVDGDGIGGDPGSWGPGWVPLGGQTFHAPAVASRGAGSLYLFVHGTDGILYRQKFANGSWDGLWEGRGGRNARFKDSPAAVTVSGGSLSCGNFFLHVFLRGGGSGELHHLRDCPN